MQNIQFKVNPDVYVAQLQKELAAHFADLRNALRTIEDGSFVTRAIAPRPEGVVHFQLDTAIAHEGAAVGRACNSCFLNLVWFLKLTILAGDEEITSLPFVAGEGTNISVRVGRLEKTFQSNTKVALSEEDIERVFSTIQYLIGPEIRRALSSSDPDA